MIWQGGDGVKAVVKEVPQSQLREEEAEMEKETSYFVKGTWKGGRNGLVSAEGIPEPTITFSAPVEFKGESGHWTPEHFLVAALVSCFVVTFAAMAESSKLNFLSLEVSVEGKLGKVDGKLGFAEVVLRGCRVGVCHLFF